MMTIDQAEPDATDGPLTGVRVLELGHALAGPFCGTLLADMGAEVLKIEKPGSGDSLRKMGPSREGVGLWWSVTGRNKKSIGVDMKQADGLEIIKALVARSDAVVENFRPGVLESLGLGWDELRVLNPQLVLLRVSGFGQTGPYGKKRGFGKIGEALSGATNLTGNTGEDPVHPGYSLADAVSGLMGAFGIVSALHHRDRGGAGQVIDLALYETLFRMIEWQLPLETLTDIEVTRNGVAFPFSEAFITGIWPATDGTYVVVSAATLETVRRIFQLVKDEGELDGVEWDDGRASRSEITAAAERWIRKHDVQTILDRFEQAGAVAGIVYDPAAMLKDPHFEARGNIVHVAHPTLGPIPMPGVVPKMDRTPGRIRWAGPTLGEHTDEVLRSVLGYDEESLRSLRDKDVIA